MKGTNFTDRFKRGISVNALFALLFILPLLTLTTNLSAQCTVSVNAETNISIEGYDLGCVANVTYEMVGTFGSTPGCGSLYRINLRKTMTSPILETVDNGTLVVDGNSISDLSYSYIGQSFIIELVDITTNNMAWGIVKFEDKLPPVITCGADTIPCYVDVTWANINPDDCSGPVTPHIVNLVTEEIPCGETNYLRRILRTYYATDAAGNSSDVCTDTLVLERPNLDSINFPLNVELYCDENYAKDANGNPHVSVTGVPTIGNDEYVLYPNNLMNACGMFTDYADQVIDLGCMKKIMRTWTVNEWYCGDDEVATYVQMIVILDDEAPVLTVPANVTISTNSSTCLANYTVPAASATDNCQTNFQWTVTYPGGFKNTNGGFNIQLPVGEHTITYTVSDGCVNNATGSYTVTVVDDQAPHAICVEYTVATIPNGSEFVRVFPESFDNGSWDNCGPVTFKVARMVADCNGDLDPQTDRQDYVDFYCCDITGQYVVVILYVYDASGNESQCMVNIKIQDKTPPIINCPPSVRVACGTEYDIDDLGATFGYVVTDADERRTGTYTDLNGNTVTGYIDGLAVDNCGVTIQESVTTTFNNCGSGTIRRTFTVTDPSGNARSCTQTIEIYKTPLNLHINDFIAPLDLMIVDGTCNVTDLDPDDLDDIYRPRFKNDPVSECFILAYSYKDELYTQVSDACFKIIRYWTIIDWCYAEVYGIDAALETGVRFTQIIKVKNTVAPEFAPIADMTICSNDETCDTEYVTVSNTATDDCTADNLLRYNYRVDYNYAVNGVPTWDRTGTGNNASGVYPLGTHRVCFYATDLCGNVAESCVIVTVNNCKKPTPVAHMLVTEIMPSTGTIGLPAWYFNAGSFSACGGPLKYSYSSDVNDTFHVFTCDDIGNNPPASIEFWVTDQWGNQDYVVVTVIVQDNNNVCDDTNTLLVGGNIFTENNLGIPKVKVTAGNSMNTSTSNEGAFRFSSMVPGQTYVVKPSSERDPMNGVETGDIIKIQNHILGKKSLDGPYKLVAADVNMDKNVTIADIVAMRRLILGKSEQFPSGLSWRFVDKAYQFPASNPLQANFPEEIAIVFNGSVNNADFFGVKLGDVNDNVTLNLNDNPIEVRNNNTLVFAANDELLTAGVPTQVTFTAENFASIEGFQMAVKSAPGVAITDITSDEMNVSSENYNFVSEDVTRISWNTESQSPAFGTVTFTIVTNRNMNVSEAISVASNDLKAAAYDNRDNEYNVEFGFNNSASVQNVIVHQNRPNPFTDETYIAVELPEELDVTVKVYDMTGKVIKKISGVYSQGYNEILINAAEIETSGVFYYEVSTKLGAETKKMIRLKN